MSRSVLTASAAAALAAVAISAGVVGSPVDVADAARPFSVSKKQFTSVKKTSVVALKTSRKNARAIKKLTQGSVAGASGAQGPKGDTGAQGPAGGFDPTKVSRVDGVSVDVSNAVDYVQVAVQCPAGAIAIGGGWYMSTSGGADYSKLHIGRSSPYDANLGGWSFRFAYDSAVAKSIRPYAICAGA